VCITVPLESKADLVERNAQLWATIKLHKGVLKQVEKGWRGRFTLASGAWIAVFVANFYGKRFIQYDLKPGTLCDADFAEFFELSLKFPGVTYADALHQGRVSRLEVAFDFLFNQTCDVLTYVAGTTRSARYFPPAGGAPTSYTGGAKGHLVTAAYTKLDPFMVGGHEFTASRARVELRFRHLGVQPLELVGAAGALVRASSCRLEIYSLSKAQQQCDVPKCWAKFLALASEKNVPAALQMFPNARKALLGTLRCCHASWWKPLTQSADWEEAASKQLRLHLAEFGPACVADPSAHAGDTHLGVSAMSSMQSIAHS
jgi:hypothetical protein